MNPLFEQFCLGQRQRNDDRKIDHGLTQGELALGRTEPLVGRSRIVGGQPWHAVTQETSG